MRNKLKTIVSFLLICSICSQGMAQRSSGNPAADHWVDSVFKTLSKKQKIAQLMVVRVSSIGADRKVVFYDKQVEEAIRKYNIGGLCLFQGGPVQQATILNRLQSAAQTPLLVTIDAENGVGMRMDSVLGLPRQMMMGAVQDRSLIYEYGRVVGEQCKRIGIQVNYAPVVDINNNPNNPVINDRSFGEDKYKVAEYGIAYMKGMQDVGVMGCAKHFPGHGDVDVDSHLDLPVINKTKAQLDSLELYPFNQIFRAGVGSVMVAHLSVPSIDNTAHTPTSISYNNVTTLLRKELNYNGLTFTDALEMKGVAKYFPDGEASREALIAGNDMLCLPGDIPGSIKKVRKAIRKGKLHWSDINEHVRKVLYAKYEYGLANWKPIDTTNILADLNSKVATTRRAIAKSALTLLRNDDPAIFPLYKGQRIAYVGVGLTQDNAFAEHIRRDYDAQVFYFDYKKDSTAVAPLLQQLKEQYDVVVIGVHKFARYPANNFGISKPALQLIQGLQQQQKTITFVFGNPYAIKNMCDARVLVAAYEDDDITQTTASDLLHGRFLASGKLPVTVCPSFKYGDGIIVKRLLPTVPANLLGFNEAKLTTAIDSIVTDAIKQKAIPGAVVLVAKDGKIAYEKAFGYLTYDSIEPVYPETIYDLASVTKIMATTLSVMKLYDEGKLDLQKTLGDYLPYVRKSNKAPLKLWDILLHQAGLKAFIPFYRETLDPANGNLPRPGLYNSSPDSMYTFPVAANLYIRKDWEDTMMNRILKSDLAPLGKYIYSDNDYIFLGKIVEAITHMPLDQYVKKTFYDKLNLVETGFNPAQRFPLDYIAPTEREKEFRNQLIHGYVHDPGAAMFGGVAGHAGLFSNAYEVGVLAQMLLNGGVLNGQNFFSRKTVDYFNQYHSAISRRGLGFDKPEKDNATRQEPYPTLSASPQTFGHTGFTGTCFWVDPKKNLIFVFLSNRVNSPDVNKFLRMSIRPKVHEAIYQSLKPY
ncbi:glycoside hydrolase family 3 N-terminal domain-containing protein [Niastella sp. OAS944]|uniref:glycoside hydrolase family 3 N-terminal domain-containing protein n=1 Tax=Niastella sp. OAS944 TaxID=2664089 RepID=UPI0034892BFD|nr:beta-glucosidase-like glycosyl hydrolase/CubicO group peptidase (beta-lactamase class C family) [Chitinophagaceae bacterium OAS944]